VWETASSHRPAEICRNTVYPLHADVLGHDQSGRHRRDRREEPSAVNGASLKRCRRSRPVPAPKRTQWSWFETGIADLRRAGRELAHADRPDRCAIAAFSSGQNRGYRTGQKRLSFVYHYRRRARHCLRCMRPWHGMRGAWQRADFRAGKCAGAVWHPNRARSALDAEEYPHALLRSILKVQEDRRVTDQLTNTHSLYERKQVFRGASSAPTRWYAEELDRGMTDDELRAALARRNRQSGVQSSEISSITPFGKPSERYS